MPDIRYLGSTHWTRTILDDNGKWKAFEKVAPGETFSAEGDLADRLLSGPRYNRLFVQAGGPEDPNSEGYREVRDVGSGGMYVSPDVGIELGSTTPDNRVIFRTEDDNEENYVVAPPEAGPQSDNARLVEEDEIQAEADKARQKARESRSSSKSAPTRSALPSGSGSGASTQSSAQRSERSGR